MTAMDVSAVTRLAMAMSRGKLPLRDLGPKACINRTTLATGFRRRRERWNRKALSWRK